MARYRGRRYGGSRYRRRSSGRRRSRGVGRRRGALRIGYRM